MSLTVTSKNRDDDRNETITVEVAGKAGRHNVRATLKWDGCCDVWIGDDEYLHLCDFYDVLDAFAEMKRIGEAEFGEDGRGVE